jgi:dTDP-4-dehydro-6-deoxy-alpha-D-glucopyranose 2,3-dehydratase
MPNENPFSSSVIRYQSYLKSQEEEIDLLRLETQVESLKDWSQFGSLETLKEWYLEQQSTCGMAIEDIPLASCREWSLNEETGYISHSSGDFFFIQGVRIKQSDGREIVGGWDQPMMTQVGYNGGLLGILRKRFEGVPHYLVEAKAEPGNPDTVQISPTLQATFSNLKKAHGGRKPHFAEFFETPDQMGGQVLFDQWMSEDGGRLHLKRNKGMLVEVDETAMLPELPRSFRWVSLFQLKSLIKENSWVNPHIRGIISHL